MNSIENDQASPGTLYRLLDDWKELTPAETASIRSSDWPGLEKLHARKLQLQSLIEASESKFFESENVPAERKSSAKKHLRELAAELLALEEKNRKSLADLMAQADTQLKTSNKAIRSLRHVQQAYGAADRSFWQAYS